MFSFEAENIFHVLKPIHFCSKVTGLTSFSIKKDCNHRYRSFVSLYNVFCVFAMAFLNVFGISSLFAANSNFALDPVMLTSFFERCLLIVVCFDFVIIIGINWWFLLVQDKVVELLDEIRLVDEALMETNIHINHSLHRKIVLCTLIASKLANISGSTIAFINAQFTNIYTTNLTLSIIDYVGKDYVIMFCLQCMFLLLGIRLRYQKINFALKQLQSRKLQSFDGNCQRLADVHDKLVDSTLLTNFRFAMESQ